MEEEDAWIGSPEESGAGRFAVGRTSALQCLRRRLPILDWLPAYDKGKLISDIIAGITVGLTVVPQSIAYSAIAGLSPEYGLYSSYIGVILYVVLGSCNILTVGPTAVIGLLTFEICGSDFPSCVTLTAFYSGFFQLLMAVMNLGMAVSFISEPVMIGFTAGAACTIASSQLKNFFGFQGEKGSGFIGYWRALFENIYTYKPGDTLMGLSSLLFLVILKEIRNLPFKRDNQCLKKPLWVLSISRNILILLITSLVAFFWADSDTFSLTGEVRGGFPPFAVPTFELPVNSTSSETLSFWSTLKFLKAGPALVALTAVLQNMVIAKSFRGSEKVDATQEMVALGVSNIVGSFFSAIPISGSFSRSAVNEASGAQTPMSGLSTGALVLLCLGLLTEEFYYLPKASLAAVIICAVICMVDYGALVTLWKIKRTDFLCCIITMLASILIGMDQGILIGVGVSLCFLLKRSLQSIQPEIRQLPNNSEISYIFAKPKQNISFPSMDLVQESILHWCSRFPDIPFIVIDLHRWTCFDYTVIVRFTSIIKRLQQEKIQLIFLPANPVWMEGFRSAGFSNPELLFCEEENLNERLTKLSLPEPELQDV